MQLLNHVPPIFRVYLRVWPLWLALLIGLTILAASLIPNARLEAGAESFTLETDPSLAAYRESNERYDNGDFFVVTFEPRNGDVLTPQSLSALDRLVTDLKAMNRFSSVTSILDLPLLQSPEQGLSVLSDTPRTLRAVDIDLALVRRELTTSPLFQDLVLSRDSSITGIQLSLPVSTQYYEWISQRNALLVIPQRSAIQEQELTDLVEEIKAFRTIESDRHSVLLETLRTVVDKHKVDGDIFIGGAPMIAEDMLGFIRNDVKTFGAISFLLMLFVLGFSFRSVRWVVVPLLMSVMVVIWIGGYLALIDWRLSVISSNFSSLLFILSLAVNVHLIVRFRELRRCYRSTEIDLLLWNTLHQMFKPCLYSVLTTLVAFMSLVMSGISPVIDFGLIMSLGLSVAFLLSFFSFPLWVRLFGPGTPPAEQKTPIVLNTVGRFSSERGGLILLISIVLAGFGFVGIERIKVENRFIDYFDRKTEIYQGLALIDQKLGGTTPLDILVSPPENWNDLNAQDEGDAFSDFEGEEDFADFEEEDGFADFEEEEGFTDFEEEGGTEVAHSPSRRNVDSYWFTQAGLNELREIQAFIAEQPATGKIMSLVTTVDTAEIINNGRLDDFTLAFLKNVMPEDIAAQLLYPYWHPETDEARISIRLVDSTPDLVRADYVRNLVTAADSVVGPERVNATGLLVLYNNMVSSLFDSQIKTLGAVFVGIFLMFLVLFRSLKIAAVALVPNVLSAIIIIGVMGLMDIPLDFMTITIAAIVVGIGVDNCIHYIVRYRDEISSTSDKKEALLKAHGSIGEALSITSGTIVLGFAVLGLSLFTPTVVFGLLTAISMVLALLGALVLLPRLLIILPIKTLRG